MPPTALCRLSALLSGLLLPLTALASDWGPVTAGLGAAAPPALQSRSWILVDLGSQQLLGRRNADQPLPPKALAQLMTAYLALQATHAGGLQRGQLLPVPAEALGASGPRMLLDSRQPVSFDQLMLGLVVDSGSDAALTLAAAVSGSKADFVSLMNRQAEQWGLSQTRFSDPAGIDDGARSSAADLARIGAHIVRDYALDYGRYFRVREFSYNRQTQSNPVGLLFTDPTVDGLKVGGSMAAGWGLVVSAQRPSPSGPRRLLAVLLGAPDPRHLLLEGQSLLNWGFQSFDDVRLADAGQTLLQARVWKGESASVGLGSVEPLLLSIPHGMAGQLQLAVQRPEPLVAPIRRGQTIGTLQARLNGRLIASLPLQALQSVPEAGFFKRLFDSLRLLIQ